MTHQDLHLEFRDLSLEITLTGFPRETASRLAERWLCELSAEGTSEGSFRLVLSPNPALIYDPETVQKAIEAGRLSYQQVGEEDQLHLPGTRVRFRPSSPTAEIEIHSDLISNLGILQLAAEGALSQALQRNSALCIHAAAFEFRDIPLLVLGPSGSGKSTIAALALAAGGRVVSDDSLVLAKDPEGQVMVRPLRRDLLLRNPTPGFLPENLRSNLVRQRASSEERWALPRASYADLYLPQLYPAAVCFLQAPTDQSQPRLTPKTHASALAEIAEANVGSFFLQVGYRGELDELMGLVDSLISQAPAFDLEMQQATPESSLECTNALEAQLTAGLAR